MEKLKSSFLFSFVLKRILLSILGVGKLGNDMKQTFLLTNILTNEETEIIDCNVPPPTTTYNNTLFIRS